LLCAESEHDAEGLESDVGTSQKIDNKCPDSDAGAGGNDADGRNTRLRITAR
jgi:hypothetical protein